MTDEKYTDLVKAVPLQDTRMVLDLGNLFGLPTQSLLHVVRDQIIGVPKGAPEPSDAEMALVLSTMKKYELDPMVRQMSAWRDNKGKLCIMVEQPGWVAFANRQPGYQRASYKFGQIIPSPDGKGKKCHEYVQVTIYDGLRGNTEMPPVWLEEWYVPQRGNYEGNWQKYTKHRLAMKAYNMGIKQVYGFSVYDEIDHDQMVPAVAPFTDMSDMAQGTVESLTEALEAGKGEHVVDDDCGENAVPCGIAGCDGEWTHACAGCKAFFCGDHLDEQYLCPVCRTDGGSE